MAALIILSIEKNLFYMHVHHAEKKYNTTKNNVGTRQFIRDLIQNKTRSEISLCLLFFERLIGQFP